LQKYGLALGTNSIGLHLAATGSIIIGYSQSIAQAKSVLYC
jgi:hypothetical protein